ncbi:MAG: hypothetical protein ABIR26_02045, partial [Ramlibacter sp.]
MGIMLAHRHLGLAKGKAKEKRNRQPWVLHVRETMLRRTDLRDARWKGGRAAQIEGRTAPVALRAPRAADAGTAGPETPGHPFRNIDSARLLLVASTARTRD